MTEHHAASMAAEDRAFQDALLPGVSRTFAFTIPQLPEPLRATVTNAYLLCRLADTLEDHATLDVAGKRACYRLLLDGLESESAGAAFAAELCGCLPPTTPASERELAAEAARVLRIARGLPPQHRAAIGDGLAVLCEGMGHFQTLARPDGLSGHEEFDRYCYHVAGVVGEMLTRLFVAHSPDIARHGDELMRLAVSFGQGLQMTNILKDIWEDRAAGVCWLPRELFERHGCTLDPAADWAADPGFRAALGELIAEAHGHLRAALRYTLLIPAQHVGIRRFCAWAIGLALLTLRRLDARRDFRSAAEVKISRRSVRIVVLGAGVAVRHDRLLGLGFRLCAGRLGAHSNSSIAGKVTAVSGYPHP